MIHNLLLIIDHLSGVTYEYFDIYFGNEVLAGMTINKAFFEVFYYILFLLFMIKFFSFIIKSLLKILSKKIVKGVK